MYLKLSVDVNLRVMPLLSSRTTSVNLPSHENVLYLAIGYQKWSVACKGKNVNKADIPFQGGIAKTRLLHT